MSKRKSLTKKSVRSASPAGRIVVSPGKLDSISPGPSAEAVRQIERYEAATLRAEQRLGMVRLA